MKLLITEFPPGNLNNVTKVVVTRCLFLCIAVWMCTCTEHVYYAKLLLCGRSHMSNESACSSDAVHFKGIFK
jgi:hypothetical protein